MSTVSVHIVTYNSGAYIKDCLEAVLQQSHPIAAIIVVDNHSTDHTEQVLQPYLNRITFVKNASNVGFAEGHNQAMRISDAEYVLVLNPDVTMNPDYIHFLVQEIKDAPQMGSATGKLLFKQSPEVIDSTGLIMTKARRCFDRGAGEACHHWDVSGDVFGVSGAAALYSKKMVLDISVEDCFFDEDFFAYKEDVDVAWRSRLMGWQSFYCSKALAYHDRGWKKGARTQIPLFIRRLSYINRYKMIIKNDSIQYVLLHCLPILIYEGLSFIYLMFKEPGVLLAWGSLLRNFSQLINKRKRIYTHKKANLAMLYRYFK